MYLRRKVETTNEMLKNRVQYIIDSLNELKKAIDEDKIIEPKREKDWMPTNKDNLLNDLNILHNKVYETLRKYKIPY